MISREFITYAKHIRVLDASSERPSQNTVSLFLRSFMEPKLGKAWPLAQIMPVGSLVDKFEGLGRPYLGIKSPWSSLRSEA